MGLRNDGRVSNLIPKDSRLGQATGPISSLNEAWIHSLDNCVIDTPLNELIVPLLRNWFLVESCTWFCCCRTVTAIS
jgi:hypothetical protein